MILNMQLKWGLKTARVLLSAGSAGFDPVTVGHWEEEGFIVSCLAYSGSRKDYAASLRAIAEPLEFGEEFVLVCMFTGLPNSVTVVDINACPCSAYGDAATAALEACTKPIYKMKALVCYYPSAYPPARVGFPPNLKVLLHLASDSPGPPIPYPTFSYPHATRGFAEPGSPQYERISADLSWSRTLGVVRKGFGIEQDLESIWENHLARKLPQTGSNPRLNKPIS